MDRHNSMDRRTVNGARLLTVFLLAMAFTQVTAQDNTAKRKVTLKGEVVNAATNKAILNPFSKEKTEAPKIVLLSSDSTEIDSAKIDFRTEWPSMKITNIFEFYVPAQSASYIIKATHPDFETTYLPYELEVSGRNPQYELPVLRMKRPPREDLDGGDLGEVVVKATRLKMVWRGDTLIYNADAFNLPEGSMLDALIRQLPGAELNSQGEIKVNGRKVDELTLNGKDFFKNNKKMMLENLPSYVVKNIKVFNKTTERSQWSGYDVEDKIYSMDVVLKRDYNTGLMANADIGAGTSDRYAARAFGMRYTNNSRLTLFTNINNLNNEDRVMGEGEWFSFNTPSGRQTTRIIGGDLTIDEKDGRWKETTMFSLKWNRNDDETRSATEQYLTSGTVFGRNENLNRLRQIGVGVYNQFTLKKPIWLQNDFWVDHRRNDANSFLRSGTADQSLAGFGDVSSTLDSIFLSTLNPDLQTRLINRQHMRGMDKTTATSLNDNLDMSFKLKSGDELLFYASGVYNYTNTEAYSQQDVNYFRVADSDLAHNRYNDSPVKRGNFDIAPGYRMRFGSNLTTKLVFRSKIMTRSEEKNHYRLDLLPGWGNNGEHPMGSLPSNRNEMLAALDATNTYSLTAQSYWQSGEFQATYERNKNNCRTYIEFHMNAEYDYDRLHYIGQQADSRISQGYFRFSPGLYGSINKDDYRINHNFNIRLTQSLPDLQSKLDIVNDANPLAIRLGNPHLKGEIQEKFYFSTHYNSKKRISNNATVEGTFRQRSQAQAYTYDPTTGVYTFRPTNVNGNWNINLSDFFKLDFGKDRVFWWTLTPSIAFSQSVDMSGMTGDTESTLSKVRATTWGTGSEVGYQKNGLRISLSGRITNQHATGNLPTFAKLNTHLFTYGMDANYLIPGIKATLDTNIKMYSRRGFASPEMNRNELIWNLSLSRQIYKEIIGMRFEAFDLLHRLSNTTVIVNGQGRTETVTNTLPRYAMLHLTFKLNRQPKKH